MGAAYITLFVTLLAFNYAVVIILVRINFMPTICATPATIPVHNTITTFRAILIVSFSLVIC